MTVETPEMVSQIAQLGADRDVREPLTNAERLNSWRSRYWHRTVDVPESRDPPKWPVVRSSLSEPAKVVKITKARAR